MVAEKGSSSYFSYNTRIDYGRAQAITRKGAQGIRLWVAYQPSFPRALNQAIWAYSGLPRVSTGE